MHGSHVLCADMNMKYKVRKKFKAGQLTISRDLIVLKSEAVLINSRKFECVNFLFAQDF